MSEPNYLLTNSHLISNPSTQIMRVDLDGGFTVNESIPATDAAKEVLRIMKEQWFADVQATKIREQQDRIKRLEEALESIREYWNRDNNQRAMVDACWYAIDKSSEALEAKEAKP